MDGSIIGFIIWALVGCFMIGLGISAFFSKKADKHEQLLDKHPEVEFVQI